MTSSELCHAGMSLLPFAFLAWCALQAVRLLCQMLRRAVSWSIRVAIAIGMLHASLYVVGPVRRAVQHVVRQVRLLDGQANPSKSARLGVRSGVAKHSAHRGVRPTKAH